jgi:hypothetical protein
MTMQKFSIEVNTPTEIVLTDNDHFEQRAIISVIPNKNARGFKILIGEMTDRVALITDETDEFANEFTFDKKEFEERMEKLRSK